MKARIASCLSVSLVGAIGHLVSVESHISDGMSQFTIVGLPDASVNEARPRVLTAFRSARIILNECHITVNLAPASLPKRGSAFDLAIATSVLGAYGMLDASKIKDIVIIGELGLDGRIHPVNGILPSIISAKNLGKTKFIVPLANKNEAELVDGADIFAAGHLSEVINHFGGEVSEVDYKPAKIPAHSERLQFQALDFSEVLGQNRAKFALEVAAAGFHNMLMLGPPGTGKSMLAMRLPSILPKLSRDEALEVTSLHSIAGGNEITKLIDIPPFEAPHHTSTAPAIIGGGSGIAMPGAVSRAHRGVLFLDEAPEFSPRVLQTLRQPLESGEVVIDRANGKAAYPARFQLIMAANPCPCGMFSSKNDRCRCTSIQQRRYLAKLSGPLLDRVDINCEVQNVQKADLKAKQGESSATIRARVTEARNRAKLRLKETPWIVNAEVPGSWLRKKTNDEKLINALHNAVDSGTLSLRGSDRTLRLAWTLADLRNAKNPNFDDIQQALMLKAGEH